MGVDHPRGKEEPTQKGGLNYFIKGRRNG